MKNELSELSRADQIFPIYVYILKTQVESFPCLVLHESLIIWFSNDVTLPCTQRGHFWQFGTPRLEICHDRRDRRSCKKFSSCVKFSRNNAFSCKICVKIWNLLIYLVTLYKLSLKTWWIFTYSFQHQQKRTKLIYFEIYAALLLAKIAATYVF